MQYVGKVGDYVYNQWNLLNPATLSGAIDIIVVEHPDGSLQCLPWHVRFGKFQIFKPLQKKIDLYVNDCKTDLPMKLGDGGEAHFVFETDALDLSASVITSPVVSASSSAAGLPHSTFSEPSKVPDDLDLNAAYEEREEKEERPTQEEKEERPTQEEIDAKARLDARSEKRAAFEKVKRYTKRLNIPSKIDANGDMVLDMDGYKPNSQRNIDELDETVHRIFLEELEGLLNGVEPEHKEFRLLQSVICKDADGKIRIVNSNEEHDLETALLQLGDDGPEDTVELAPLHNRTYFKTLRLTLEQLALMKLQYGRNRLRFKLSLGTSHVELDLYLWKLTTPLVISDIDGTITKLDALGHVFNMLGKDWTHPGVARLFDDICLNGYNIMYLTARSVGQADTTRQYLESITQDGVRLPKGPVILSPERTMAALKREIILKKPEVFKMACLRDIQLLFSKDESLTPFYAGFGNRITDAISYRSVHIPLHRIFTINTNGEVHMELLELAGYKLLYLHIGELVDQFFPPLKLISDVDNYWNEDQLNNYMSTKMAKLPPPHFPGLALPRSMGSHGDDIVIRPDEKFTDLNYWREPMANFSDLSDLEEDDTKSGALSPALQPAFMPGSPLLLSQNDTEASPKQERPLSASFTSPLKSFMARGNQKLELLKDDFDDEDDDDYTDDYDDDYTDGGDDYDAEVDDEDLDADLQDSHTVEQSLLDGQDVEVVKASLLLSALKVLKRPKET